MRNIVTVLLAAVVLCQTGCFSHRRDVEADPWLKPGQIGRIGVLPFIDPRGQGREFTEEFRRGLEKLKINTIDTDHLLAVFKELELSPAGGLSLASLWDVRKRTLADALIFGSLQGKSWGEGKGKWQGISMLMLDTSGGEVVLRVNLQPPAFRAYKDRNEVLAEALNAVKGPLGRGGPMRKRKLEKDKDLQALDVPY